MGLDRVESNLALALAPALAPAPTPTPTLALPLPLTPNPNPTQVLADSSQVEGFVPKTGGVKAGPERYLMMPPKLRKVPATTVQTPTSTATPTQPST